MCCAFCGYHAVRRAVLRNNSAIDSNLNIPTCLFRQHWGPFAAAFMAEAGGLKIPDRKFTLPKFISVQPDTPDCLSASHRSSNRAELDYICIYIYIEDACDGSSPHPLESANAARI